MKVLVLGYGNIGSVVTADLAENMSSSEIVLSGRRRSNAEKTARAIHQENVRGIQVNAHNFRELVTTLKEFDVVVGTLPGNIGYRAMKAAIAAKVDMVDVSYMPENPLALNEEARKANITIVPDCGVAPGISNLLVGHAVHKLAEIENVHIMVGGIPEKLVPPLNYIITWSVANLLDEYCRKAKIVRNGQIVEVEALTGLETISFPGVGHLEGFYTDGLRTLLHTVKGVRNMWEKTLRYPGHAEKIKMLKILGFFDERPIKVAETRLAPRLVTIKLLEKHLKKPKMRDLLAMKIEVSGIKKQKKRYIYHLVDKHDRKRRVTAMARTTAYPASILAQFIAKKKLVTKGVVPLEQVGKEEDIFRKIIAELEKRQIKITENVRSSCP